MAGATWTTRQPTDWLASDGKWYPTSKYPRGWEGTALPPAPGHGGVASILKKYTQAAADLVGIDDGVPDHDVFHSASAAPETSPPPRAQRPSTERQAPRVKTPPPPGGEAASGFSVVKTGRQIAQATVSEQRDYAHKLSSGTPPPAPLGSGTTTTSPGRVRDLPPPPDSPNSIERSKAPPPPDTPAQNIEVIAGDLGKVLGGAKKRIQQALNDAYEGQ